MSAAVFVARILLGGLLLATGILKAGHAAELAAAMAGFRLLPGIAIGPLALALPFFEIVLGGYLVAGLFTRIAGWVACVQFLVYGAAIASAVLRNIPANCGCFGPNDVAVADWPHVGFDLALALIAAFVARNAPGAFALDRRLQGTR